MDRSTVGEPLMLTIAMEKYLDTEGYISTTSPRALALLF